MAAGSGAGPADGVGITAMYFYVPRAYVRHAELGTPRPGAQTHQLASLLTPGLSLRRGHGHDTPETFDGVPTGKYVVGLGQQGMAVCGDNEDAVSLSMSGRLNGAARPPVLGRGARPDMPVPRLLCRAVPSPAGLAGPRRRPGGRRGPAGGRHGDGDGQGQVGQDLPDAAAGRARRRRRCRRRRRGLPQRVLRRHRGPAQHGTAPTPAVARWAGGQG